MFDIGAIELLLIAAVAILVIGPKEMPTALRAAGRWVGKMRRLSSQFRSGFDAIVREAEMEDMEKKWKAQNEKIMRQHPQGTPEEMEPTGAYPPKPAASTPAAGDASTDASASASTGAATPASAESAAPAQTNEAKPADNSGASGDAPKGEG